MSFLLRHIARYAAQKLAALVSLGVVYWRPRRTKGLGGAIWESRFKQGETDMGDKGKKDKGKREQQKKAQRNLKGKRKQKKEKKK